LIFLDVIFNVDQPTIKVVMNLYRNQFLNKFINTFPTAKNFIANSSSFIPLCNNCTWLQRKQEKFNEILRKINSIRLNLK